MRRWAAQGVLAAAALLLASALFALPAPVRALTEEPGQVELACVEEALVAPGTVEEPAATMAQEPSGAASEGQSDEAQSDGAASGAPNSVGGQDAPQGAVSPGDEADPDDKPSGNEPGDATDAGIDEPGEATPSVREPIPAPSAPDDGAADSPVDPTVEPVAEGQGTTDVGSGDPDAADDPAEGAESPAAPEHVSEWVRGDDGSYSWYDESGRRQSEGWVVTGKTLDNGTGGLQRYWIANGTLLFDGLFSFTGSDGLLGWGYARPEGYVVRGKWTHGKTGLVYLANNDGRLEDAGWLVTDDYDGSLQRYWIDPGTHAAEPGYSTDGGAHYTTKAGYVQRTTSRSDDGELRSADNDGMVQESGWLVTDGFGQGLQRYWIEDGKAASEGLWQTGEDSWTYVGPSGYVVRGSLATVSKLTDRAVVYLADNDGLLAGGAKCGWVVSDLYGQGLQRYWIDPEEHAAVVGHDDGSVGQGNWAHYPTAEGHVLRGALSTKDGMFWADNDGLLKESGWLVTDGFGQGLQRYWLSGGRVADEGLYQTGESAWTYVGPHGYVARGKYVADDGLVYLADNDGLLASPGWHVSDAYGDGLQRYYVDGERHAAVPGHSADGWSHYTLPQGYVLRGKLDSGRGYVYVADNDGELLDLEADGWVVTDRYDGELQRYWVVASEHAARSSFFVVDGTQYYGLGGEGYVARGGGGLLDNEGAITADGWVVTSAFGQGLQRYFFRDSLVALGLLQPELGGYWAFSRPEGYVVRGKYASADGFVYLADNDGRLEDAGWLVTSVYDGGLQRYYVDADAHGARTGLFQVGAEHYYGLGREGYVLRGTLAVDGKLYHGDNDGCLVLSLSTDASAKKGATAEIVGTFVGDTVYLFLPAHASLASVPLRFDAFDGSGTVLVSLDGSGYAALASGTALDFFAARLADGARVIWFKTSEGARARTLAVMISAEVRAMYLVSEDPLGKGRPYIDGSPDHSTRASGTMLLVDPDGTVVYNGKLDQIKGRGNTTWVASAKKPYQIKLGKKADLLETGDSSNKAKTWVLLANASDVTLLRNTVAYELARALGLEVTPQSAPVDLYYDGEYRGSYLLCEKVEIRGGRVDIFELEDAVEDVNPGVDLDELPVATATNRFGFTFQYVMGVRSPADTTGGYLVELDNVFYASERSWFRASCGTFVVKGPESCSYEMMRYISEYFQEAIDACGGAGVGDYLDVDSAARMYLVNELSKNIDWGTSSCYFYLPSHADAKAGYRHVLYAGPAWDFDASFGTRTDAPTARSTEGIYFQWGPFVAMSPDVIRRAKELGSSELMPLVREGLLAGRSDKIDSIAKMAGRIAASRAMNYRIWSFSPFANCAPAFPTYEENLSYLTSWISQRIDWLSRFWL